MTRNAITQDTSSSLPMSATTTTVSERPLSPAPSKRWNADRFGTRLGVDVASAATAGALTCPVITVIDRYFPL